MGKGDASSLSHVKVKKWRNYFEGSVRWITKVFFFVNSIHDFQRSIVYSKLTFKLRSFIPFSSRNLKEKQMLTSFCDTYHFLRNSKQTLKNMRETKSFRDFSYRREKWGSLSSWTLPEFIILSFSWKILPTNAQILPNSPKFSQPKTAQKFLIISDFW